MRAGGVFRVFLEPLEGKEDLAAAAFGGEEDPEGLPLAVFSDLVDVASNVAGGHQAAAGDVTHGGQDGGQVVAGEAVEEVPDWPATGGSLVEAPPPSDPGV